MITGVIVCKNAHREILVSMIISVLKGTVSSLVMSKATHVQAAGLNRKCHSKLRVEKKITKIRF